MEVLNEKVIFKKQYIEEEKYQLYRGKIFPFGCSKVVLFLLSCFQLFVTPWTAAGQAPLSMGILQAKILGWVAMPSSRGSSQPRD